MEEVNSSGIELEEREAQRERLLRQAAVRAREGTTPAEGKAADIEAPEEKGVEMPSGVRSREERRAALLERAAARRAETRLTAVSSGDATRGTAESSSEKTNNKEKSEEGSVSEEGDEEDPATKKKEPSRPQSKALSPADFAGFAAVAAATTALTAFQTLCVWDGQCLQKEDPALAGWRGRAVIPTLAIALVIVIPCALNGVGSARVLAYLRTVTDKPPKNARQLRCSVAFGLCLVLLAALLFFSLALEVATHKLTEAGFQASARRGFDVCDASASASGRWRKGRDGCKWSNDVRVHYKVHSNLAHQTKQNLQHLLIFDSLLSALFFVSAFCLALTFCCASSHHDNASCCPSSFGYSLLRPRLRSR